jgi:homoserine kinase
LDLEKAEDLPGLLGVAISGAGPTVLAFVRVGYEQEVGERIVGVWKGVSGETVCTCRHLDIDREGVVVSLLSE